MPLEREAVLRDLADADGLWPLIANGACSQCSQPRQPKWATFPTCWSCKTQNERHGAPIDNLKPVTYTAYDWTLGAGLRAFKSQGCPTTSKWAAGFGAVLSACLEYELTQRARPTYDLIVPVPTTAPVIERSFVRAAAEGWWVPPLSSVAKIVDGFSRQRERASAERPNVPLSKWVIDRPAVGNAMSVLILDDMLTTGGSLFSFAKALRGEGVAFVDAVVIARNVGHDDAQWIEPLLRDRVARGVACLP